LCAAYLATRTSCATQWSVTETAAPYARSLHAALECPSVSIIDGVSLQPQQQQQPMNRPIHQLLTDFTARRPRGVQFGSASVHFHSTTTPRLKKTTSRADRPHRDFLSGHHWGTRVPRPSNFAPPHSGKILSYATAAESFGRVTDSRLNELEQIKPRLIEIWQSIQQAVDFLPRDAHRRHAVHATARCLSVTRMNLSAYRSSRNFQDW